MIGSFRAAAKSAPSHRAAPDPRGRRATLRLEALEDRANPALLTWVGPEGGVWSDPANWDLNRLPTSSDTLVFGPGNNTGSRDDIAGLTVDGILCQSGYTGSTFIGNVELTVTNDFVSRGRVTVSAFDGPVTLDVGGDFTVAGTLVTDGWADIPVITATDLVLGSGSQWWVYSETSVTADVVQGGSLDVWQTGTFFQGKLDVAGSYHLLTGGVITLDEPLDELDYVGTTPMLLDGTVYLTDGRIDSNAGVDLTGDLIGSGLYATIDGDLTNVSGTVQFVGGSNNSILTVTGDFTQLIDGTLKMHVWMGGINDVLQVGGTVHLGPRGSEGIGNGGTLEVLDAGLVSTSTFDLIAANDGAVGSFTAFILPPGVSVVGWIPMYGNPDGVLFRVRYDAPDDGGGGA